MNIGPEFLIDACFLTVFILSVYIGAQFGAMRAFSGILGAVTAYFCAVEFTGYVSRYIVAAINPIAKGAVLKAAEDAEVTQFLDSLVGDKTMEAFFAVMQTLGFKQATASGAFEKAQGAGERLLDAAVDSLSHQLAPVIAFVLLFIVVSAAAGFLFNFLAKNIYGVKTINKLLGGLLGAVSGALIVLLLCVGAMRMAPDRSEGIINKHTVSQSIVGGFVSDLSVN